MNRRYKGVDIECTDSGAWFVAHVQIPGSNVYVIAKADTLPGIKEAINEVLNSTRKGN